MPGYGRMMGPRGFLTDEEKQNMPKVSRALLLRIGSYLRPYWPQLLLVFAAILLSSVLGLLPSVITGRIVDEALLGRDLRLLLRLLLLAFATLTASEVIGVLESYCNAWISQRIIFDMKNQMYDHLQHMPHAFFTQEKQGDIITRMNSDISGVSGVISGTLTSIVSNTATVATTLIALLTMNWRLALVGAAVIPLLILPTRSVGRTRWQILSESQEKNDEMNQLVNETLSVSGSLLVKLFARQEREYARFVAVNEEVTRLQLKEQRSGKFFHVVMGMFTQLGPLLIYLAGGLLLIAGSETGLTVGTITATVALINRLYRPVQSLLNIHVDLTRSLALFTRIFAYYDMASPIEEKTGGEKGRAEGGDIVFDRVSFAYSPDKPLLHDLSFTAPAGQMTALVGPSGAGKSSLVNLLPRLYDVTAGAVRVAGTDVRDWDLNCLRRQIGMVTQDSYLFNGTIRDNLLYAKEDATEAELDAACRAADLEGLIRSLPEGYDTQVGNRGLKLSGGEKQRLSIARAILKDPAILILDEATSALDSVSEEAVQSALEELLRGRTSIVIAHRLSTVLRADQILVIQDGTVAEQGSHEELLEKNGAYRALYETQFRRVLDREARRLALTA